MIVPSNISGISNSKSFSKNLGAVLETIICGLEPLKSTFSITALMLSPFLKKSVGIWFSFGKMYSFPSSSKMITCLPRMWCTSPTITSPILSLNISYIAALLCSCNFVAKICFNVKIFLLPS